MRRAKSKFRPTVSGVSGAPAMRSPQVQSREPISVDLISEPPISEQEKENKLWIGPQSYDGMSEKRDRPDTFFRMGPHYIHPGDFLTILDIRAIFG